MRLSVLSALARLELDPWQEANSLAGLPEATAAARLASLITLLPDGHRDPGMIAARLVALLPRRASSNISLSQTLLGPKRGAYFKPVIWVIWTVIALGAQWIAANRQPPARGDKTHALVAETISRPTSSDPLQVRNKSNGSSDKKNKTTFDNTQSDEPTNSAD